MKMELKNKLALLAISLITTITSVVSHSGDGGGTTGMMMWGDGGWMHNAGHMTGYNMWGMGWFGLVFGLTFWILVFLGIIYLYQQVTENQEGDKE